ncbi:MAG: hypothetical protein JWO86_8544 [Myxococcaceae bacterium]|jgi:hypothetical protein|nr:hypothetical protein [Myxococcaceae bacterium]MEA2751364.1 hypothetical protein [Myxococcales bacterium]
MKNASTRCPSTLAVCRHHAVRHVSQAFVVVTPIALAILTQSLLLPLLLIIVAEAFLVLVLPLIPAFQRRVQASVAREARLAVLAERARLTQMMSPSHRDELQELEAVVAMIRLRTGCGLDREDWLGVDTLLTLYSRLAVALRNSTEALSLAAAVNLDRQVASVEQMRWMAPEAERPRIAQRLAILRRRRELRTSAEERRSLMACDLAAIADLVRCLHDECVSVDGATATSEVPEAIADGMRSGATLSELAMLHSLSGDTVEPRSSETDPMQRVSVEASPMGAVPVTLVPPVAPTPYGELELELELEGERRQARTAGADLYTGLCFGRSHAIVNG